jgi:hypothetical protein
MARKRTPSTPTVQQLGRAAKLYLDEEARDFQYRVAVELLRLGRSRKTDITEPEALGVLLLSWNSNFYRYQRNKRRSLLIDLEQLLKTHSPALAGYRKRSIEGLSSTDEKAVSSLFAAFEEKLWPVGAAKALHLLGPNFFPLWDTAIRNAYGLAEAGRRRNAPRYWAFMQTIKTQCAQFGGSKRIGRPALKALDEFNYVKYTLGRKV